MRTTILWSIDALTAPERRALLGVSVFAGPFTPDQATTVTGTQAADLIPSLEGLLDASLLTLQGAGRLGVPALVRQVARGMDDDPESARRYRAWVCHERATVPIAELAAVWALPNLPDADAANLCLAAADRLRGLLQPDVITDRLRSVANNAQTPPALGLKIRLTLTARTATGAARREQARQNWVDAQPFPRVAAHAAKAYGMALLRMGRLLPAIRVFGVALDRARKLDMVPLQCLIHGHLAECHHTLGRQTVALQSAHAASVLASPEFPAGQVVTSAAIGRLYAVAGRWRRASSSLNHAREVATVHDFHNMLCWLDTMLASTALHLGEPEAAVVRAQNAAEQARAGGLARILGEALTVLADIQAHLGSLEEAQSSLHQAIAHYELVGASGQAAMCRLSLAWLHLDVGDVRAAKDLMAPSTTQSPIVDGRADLLRARLALDSNRAADALPLAQTAAHSLSRYGPALHVPAVLVCHEALCRLGDLSSARATMSQARDLVEATDAGPGSPLRLALASASAPPEIDRK